jgi:hypothetical protein
MPQADSLAKMDKYYRELGQLDSASSPPGAQSVLSQLSRQLYKTLERLNPGANTRVEWAGLSEHDRQIYVLAVRSLLSRKAELLEAISHFDKAPAETALLRLHAGDKRVGVASPKVLVGAR